MGNADGTGVMMQDVNTQSATSSSTQPRYKHPSVFACFGRIPSYSSAGDLLASGKKIPYRICHSCLKHSDWIEFHGMCVHILSDTMSSPSLDPVKLRPRCNECFYTGFEKNKRLRNCSHDVAHHTLLDYDERFLDLYRTDLSRAMKKAGINDLGSIAARKKLIRMLGLDAVEMMAERPNEDER